MSAENLRNGITRWFPGTVHQNRAWQADCAQQMFVEWGSISQPACCCLWKDGALVPLATNVTISYMSRAEGPRASPGTLEHHELLQGKEESSSVFTSKQGITA